MKYAKGYSRMNGEEPPDNVDLYPSPAPPRSLSRWLELAWHLVSVLMFTSGVLMVTVAQHRPLCTSDKECTAQLSIWSPLLEAVEYEESDWVSIFATKHSGFTGTPTREMEAKWKNMIEVPSVLIPPDKVPFLNRSIEQGFVTASSPSDGYIAGVEVFHHLHCLNVLRQYIWRDSYPEDLVPSLLKFNSPAVALEHTDHCIETLRQALMCSADVTPYLLYETKPAPGWDVPAREDFQAFHKCRKFDVLLDWVKDNGVVVPPWREGKMPA